jgi:Metal-dependent proteases with possible chaperone activity
LAKDRGVELKVVPPEYAGDNGAMIAYTGLLAYKSGQKVDPEKAMVRPRWRIDQAEIGWR